MKIVSGSQLSVEDIAELARALLSTPEVAGRANLLAAAISRALPDTACIVWARRGTSWSALGFSDEISIVQTELPDDFPLFAGLEDGPRVYPANTLTREDYAHLHVLRTIHAIGYLPWPGEQEPGGAFEIVSYGGALSESSLQAFDNLAEVAASALGAAEQYEEQRQHLLDSIHRLTQLYDLEKSLNETLDFDPLLELIPVKVAAMLPCQAIHLWMFDNGRLRLVSACGEDDTAEIGTIEGAGDGYVGDMAEEGIPLLISEEDDERLARRNARAPHGRRISGALMVPLIERAPDGTESELGVLEAVNKAGGEAFTDDDMFFMNSMSETVTSALKNASLMHAERKLEILEALVHVSAEITSTLRLDRLLQIIVNSPQSVLPFERCSIALDNRGRLQLKAVSGMASIPAGDAQVEHLRDLLQWLSSFDKQLLIRQHEEAPETDDPQVRAAIGKHFAESGYRALYALPLADDQGRVGLLLYESSNPEFLEIAHIEMIKVLAGQTTVAIRNALLYQEVPLIGLLEPLVHRKQAFMRSGRKRQAVVYGALAAVILLLIFCPMPLRISGAAVVAAQSVATLAAPADGTITRVYASEGQHVSRGQVLATMDDWAWQNELVAAQARYQAAVSAMQADLSRRSAQAGEDRTQMDYLRSEVERTRLRIANASLRSPIDGVVITPDLQNAAGEHLDAGATFAQVLDLSNARVNIAIDQRNASLVRAGQNVAIKLNSFPAQTLHGTVSSVSPEARPQGDARVFYAHVLLPNAQAQLRNGMDGRAKISAGYRPAGFVLLRVPALWFWQQLWEWIGW